MFKLTAWDVKTDKFSGHVYTQDVLLDKLAEAEEYVVERVFLYRRTMPTYTGAIFEEI